jgi:hypothetical protein
MENRKVAQKSKKNTSYARNRVKSTVISQSIPLGDGLTFINLAAADHHAVNAQRECVAGFGPNLHFGGLGSVELHYLQLTPENRTLHLKAPLSDARCGTKGFLIRYLNSKSFAPHRV